MTRAISAVSSKNIALRVLPGQLSASASSVRGRLLKSLSVSAPALCGRLLRYLSLSSSDIRDSWNASKESSRASAKSNEDQYGWPATMLWWPPGKEGEYLTLIISYDVTCTNLVPLHLTDVTSNYCILLTIKRLCSSCFTGTPQFNMSNLMSHPQTSSEPINPSRNSWGVTHRTIHGNRSDSLSTPRVKTVRL